MKKSVFFNKVVLITGGSMGIGKELARQILNNGGKVIITGRTVERLIATSNEFKNDAENLLVYAGNAANYADNIKLIEEIIFRFGRLDVLINNAGMSSNFGEIEYTDERVVNEIIDTNIKGSTFPTMVAIPELKKTKGSIIFISSIAAFRGMPAFSLYSLSKMALTALAQSIRIENKKNGIHVGIAYVGFTENDKEKRTFTYDGNLIKVPTHKNRGIRSREATAKLILTQIKNKRIRVIHSTLGKLIFLLTNYFPGIANIFYEHIYNNKKSKNI